MDFDHERAKRMTDYIERPCYFDIHGNISILLTFTVLLFNYFINRKKNIFLIIILPIKVNCQVTKYV